MASLRIALSVVALGASLTAGCGARGAPSLPASAAAHVPTPMEEALAFERGTHGVRDYRRAAAIYETRCHGGDGDAAACRKLLRAMLHERGIEFDLRTSPRLAASMCTHGEWLGCVVESMFAAAHGGLRSERAELMHAKAEEAEERCKQGDAPACEGELLLGSLLWNPSAGPNESADAEYEHYCALGLLDGCAQALQHSLRFCRDDGEAGRKRRRCEMRILTAWMRGENSDKVNALTVLSDACDAGDADACLAIPGRSIPPAILCAAHDYAACAEAACLGDLEAAKLARRHASEMTCYTAEEREADRQRALADARDEEPLADENASGEDTPVAGARAEVPLVADPPLPPIEPADLAPLDAVRVRRLARRGAYGWPRFELYNLGRRQIASVGVVASAYDASGRQVARYEYVVYGVQIAPGRSVETDTIAFTSSQGPPPGAASYTICVDRVKLTGDTDFTIDATRCPDRRPTDPAR
jgi:hypothetical protein